MLDRTRARGIAIKRVNRRGRSEWLLPKGHIELGETPRQAAEREVFEETGIHGTAGPGLGQIDYWFCSGSRRIHKYVRHFLLEMSGGELSTEDHEVIDVAWFPLARLGELLNHRDERRVLWRAMAMLGSTRT
jgi:8-oxo-dGTP pyrophosphatase MutT (NUDIX family)